MFGLQANTGNRQISFRAYIVFTILFCMLGLFAPVILITCRKYFTVVLFPLCYILLTFWCGLQSETGTRIIK